MKTRSTEPMTAHSAKKGEPGFGTLVPNPNMITPAEAKTVADSLTSTAAAIQSSLTLIPEDDTVSNEHLKRSLQVTQTAQQKYAALASAQ